MELFVDIALYSGFIPLIILFFKKKAFNFKEPIVPFIWITAIASIYEILNTNVFIVNAAYWFQIYPFLEIIGLYYFFSKVFKEKLQSSVGMGLKNISSRIKHIDAKFIQQPISFGNKFQIILNSDNYVKSSNNR